MHRKQIQFSGPAQQVIDFVRQGKVFALQDWLRDGKPIRFIEFQKPDEQLLHRAVETGFHSLVELLLKAGGWSSEELAETLEFARDGGQFHIADLLISFGAAGREVDFLAACEALDFKTAERHLRAGVNPNECNQFAEALSSIKARPLLGFYRNFRQEFPALDDQAALALSHAVQENKVRWAALLRWAGADPFRKVPYDFSGSFPVSEEDCTTAAKEAVRSSNPEMLKALQLNPNAEQALTLLEDAAFRINLPLAHKLLPLIPADKINHTERNSCAALEQILNHDVRWDGLMSRDAEGRSSQAVAFAELLLDSGARWNPPVDGLRYTRRSLIRHDGRYIVQILRLLLYTPNSVDSEKFAELCKSQTLINKVGTADAPLANDLRELRKKHAANVRDAKANTETAEVQEAPPHTPS